MIVTYFGVMESEDGAGVERENWELEVHFQLISDLILCFARRYGK